MTTFNFSTTYQEAEKQYNLGKGEYLKLKEGSNKMRLVSVCLPHPSTYQGKPQFKFLCQVIDRVDNKIKPFFMPVTVYRAIEALQLSEDYAFTEVPMPYDMSIGAIGAGTKEVKYSVTPARANTPLTEEEKAKIAEAPTVHELQQKIRDSQPPVDTRPMKEEGDDGFVTPEEVPF